MRQLFLAVAGFLLYHSGPAQITFDFSMPGFSDWRGDTSYFQIINGILQSAGPSKTASISISTASSAAADVQWEFYVQMDFNPSSTNYARFYLCSDQPNLGDPLKGYYAQLGGETGSLDQISLVMQDSSTHNTIISGRIGTFGKSLNKARIRVVRYQNGLWRLESDTTGAANFLLEGTAVDTTFITSGFL